MQVQVFKSKIHNAFVTEANIDDFDRIVIDQEMMDAVDIIEGEQVHVVNHRNGERLITYVNSGIRGSKEIIMNGPGALKISKGDKVIIIAYTELPEAESKNFKPKIIFPKPDNSF